MSDQCSVTTALSRVMAELPAIGKDDKAPVSMGGYAFRGIEAMTRVIQPLLAKHGVVIVPKASIGTVEPAPDQKPAWQDTYLTIEWTIYGPDGSSITAQTVGVGRDHTDKGCTKASTQAFKYLLLQLFCVSDAVDDGDGHDYEPYKPLPPFGAEVFRRIREATAENVRLGPLLKQYAIDNGGRSLSEKALVEDAVWARQVSAALDDYDRALTEGIGPDPTPDREAGTLGEATPASHDLDGLRDQIAAIEGKPGRKSRPATNQGESND